MSAMPIRLLLLEDNPGDAGLLQAALAEHAPGGFAITTVERLADALARIGAEPFDAILCDLGLPDSAGFATVQAIVSHAPKQPVVVLTGSVDASVGRKAIQCGAQDYLVKGEASGSTIARTLRYAVERKNLENQLELANEWLEQRVAARTAELEAAVARLTESESDLRAAQAETHKMLALSEESRLALLSVAEDQEVATRALRESEQRFRGLIEQSLTGIYISQEGVFLYANPRLEQLLGYGPGALVGVRFDDIVIAEDLPLMQAQREKLRAGATASAYEVRARRRDGALVELGVQGRIFEFGGALSTIGMAQDISEKKRAEEEIKRYLAQLETAFMSSVQVATILSELRDPYTAGHERRVGEIAMAIGAELGFDERKQEGLRVAGYLHDVGKITIPAEILSKPGRLSAIEFELIKGHAQAGYDVLKGVEFPWPVAEVARQHHERMDGGGYPQGLKGDAILFEARIMAVADVVEAMFSHRPYRASIGIDKALAEIERGRGSAYDPAVADACLKLFREKGYSIPV